MKTVLAIIGPSASGKDSLAQALKEELGDKAKIVISNTTRPPRLLEKDGIHYNFVSEADFFKETYLKETKFKKWYYGIPLSQIEDNIINICVLNLEELYVLENHFEIDTIPILCEEKFFIRLKRSCLREKTFKFEFIRRAISDYYYFLNVHEYLEEKFNHRYISNLDASKTLTRKAMRVLFWLRIWSILDNNNKL